MKLYKTFILFIILTSTVFASGGSPYTRFGLGDLIFNYSARRMGFGGLGIGISDRLYLSGVNPASWNDVNLTHFEISADFTEINMSTNIESSKFYRTKFNGLTFGFPIEKKHGIVAAFGIVPVTNVEYKIIRNSENSLVGSYSQIFSGTGGLAKAFIGATYKLPFHLNFGATFEYYFGEIEYSTRLKFPSGSNFKDAGFIKKRNYRGIGTTIGFVSDAFLGNSNKKGISNLRFGFVFNYISKLNTDTTLTTLSSVGKYTSSQGLTNTQFPIKIGVGTSFKLNDKYLFLADYLYQPWSNYKFNGKISLNLRNYQKFAFGFEKIPNKGMYSSFWEQFSYRAGLSFEQTQFDIKNIGINQYSLYFGFTVPMGISNSIDVGFQYGIRGVTDSNLLKENVFKASFTINFGQLWFVSRRR